MATTSRTSGPRKRVICTARMYGGYVVPFIDLGPPGGLPSRRTCVPVPQRDRVARPTSGLRSDARPPVIGVGSTARSGRPCCGTGVPAECSCVGAALPGGRTPPADADASDPMNPEPTVRTRLSVTIALATTLLLTSCGGDSDDAGGGSASGSDDVLRVGTEGTYAPFSFHDPSSNELTGYDVEVAKAVGAELGKKVEFSETQFDSIFAGLESDRYDVIANQVTINPEREEKYLFSTPYTVSTGVVVTRADDDSVHSLADVKGKRSAQSTTSSFAELATKAGAQVEPVEGFTQAITLLKQKRVDVTINDSLALLEYQKSTGDKDVKIAVKIDPPSEQALVFRKNEADLQTQVDGALKALRADGTLARISEKYFGEDVSGEGTRSTGAWSAAASARCSTGSCGEPCHSRR